MQYDFDKMFGKKPTCAKLLYDCPMYNMKAGDEVKMFNQEFNEQDLLRYGERLTNDDLQVEDYDGNRECCFMRIRIIKYNNTLYYHRMVNGECVECKELK